MNDLTLLPTSSQLAPQLATPDQLQQQIRELGELLTATDGKLNEIANRGFWRRTFSNNTRDLALAMRDIVKLQQYTVALVMAGLEIHANNLAMLHVMRLELEALHAGLGKSSGAHHAHAEGLVHVRNTIGHLVGVIRQHADRVEEVHHIREAADGARSRANLAAALALVAVAMGLYAVFAGGGA
jgi:hypothetical protein